MSSTHTDDSYDEYKFKVNKHLQQFESLDSTHIDLNESIKEQENKLRTIELVDWALNEQSINITDTERKEQEYKELVRKQETEKRRLNAEMQRAKEEI